MFRPIINGFPHTVVFFVANWCLLNNVVMDFLNLQILIYKDEINYFPPVKLILKAIILPSEMVVISTYYLLKI